MQKADITEPAYSCRVPLVAHSILLAETTLDLPCLAQMLTSRYPACAPGDLYVPHGFLRKGRKQFLAWPRRAQLA